MPIGPRPEPPPVPRKEKRWQSDSAGLLQSRAAPVLPPKIPHYSPIPAIDASPDVVPNPSATSSPMAYMTPVTKTRSKGPRPLGPQSLSPASSIRNPGLPYPVEPSSQSMATGTSGGEIPQISPVTSPMPNNFMLSGHELGVQPPLAVNQPLAMPEPDSINSPTWSTSPTNKDNVHSPYYAASPHSPSTHLRSPYSPSPYSSPYSPTRLRGSIGTISTLASQESANSPPSRLPYQQVPSLVPPPAVGQEKRPTKSIFQWGIPAESLPPMPVPVGSMSGLELGSAGQFTMNLDSPEIPPMEPMRPKFSVEQITVTDLQRPDDIWALSCLAKWIYELVMSFDAEFAVSDVHQSFTRLFMFRMKDLSWKTSETLASVAVSSSKSQNFIADNREELSISTSGPQISGVLTELSGNQGCYSLTSHEQMQNSSCYSSRCIQRGHQHANLAESVTTAATIAGSADYASSLRHSKGAGHGDLLNVPPTIGGTTFFGSSIDKAIDGSASAMENAAQAVDEMIESSAALEMNWRKFWNLEETDIKDIDPKLIKSQFAIHESIMSEVSFVRDLKTYSDVYGEIELMKGLSVMSNQEQFCARVFGRIRKISARNKESLVHMSERQSTQGPYVYDIADLITKWAQDPVTIQAYTDYADDYLWSDHHSRRELTQSTRLKHWMEERAKDPRITGRPHSFFFHRVLPRLARYQLLLNAVLKYMPEENISEKHNIEKAIAASNELTQQCDDRVAKQKRLLDVQNSKAHIVFKSSAVTADLKLGDKRRKSIRRGDMLRRGDMKMDWVETHTLLSDNFLVLSKTREGSNGTAFYVTKAPIPLDLLVLESGSEEGVVRMSSRLTLTRHGPIEETAANTDGEKSPVSYPSRITHLGSGGHKYVLFVPNKPERAQWANSIVEAKQSRAQLAFARSAEPFRFMEISDAFCYPDTDAPQLPVPIPDTPIYRAVTSTDPNRVSRVSLKRKVNCIVPLGSAFLIGTDFGLWVGSSPTDTVVPWTRVLNSPQRVIKVELSESMNAVFISCGDHNVTWYPSDQIVARGMGDERKPLGVRLNQHRKVIDFAVAYHHGRVVVMYLQQGGISKIVEPIRSYGAVAMRSVEKIGIDRPSSCIDSFREVERLQTSSDTVRVTPFSKSIISTTSKFFEWTTIDTKRAVRSPVGNITKEMQYYGRPIRMIQLDATHYLKCFESCFMISDYKGNDCIQPTTWFLEKVSDCAYYAPYSISFSQGGEMIEVRYVEEFPGRLVQLITGKDIKLLSNSDESVYFRMAHPWIPGRQLILEIIGNEIVKDNASTWYSSSA